MNKNQAKTGGVPQDSPAPVVKKNQPQRELTPLEKVYSNLDSLLQSKMNALPSTFNQTRFLQECMTVLQDIYGIENVSPISVARTMLRGAMLDLSFLNKECYAIPDNKKVGNEWVKEIQFQTDYKGEKKLAKKYSIRPVKDIYAKLVREGDVYEIAIDGNEQRITFKPVPFNNADVIGCFAFVLYHDGTVTTEEMSIEEINEVKENYAKKDKQGNHSGAWVKSFGEMCKKTVIRRLCKHIELQFESVDQKQTFDAASEFEVQHEPKKISTKPTVARPQAIDQDPVEVEAEVIEKETPADEQQEQNLYKQMLDEFQAAKEMLGEVKYYKVLEAHGFTKSNQIKSIAKGNEIIKDMQEAM